MMKRKICGLASSIVFITGIFLPEACICLAFGTPDPCNKFALAPNLSLQAKQPKNQSAGTELIRDVTQDPRFPTYVVADPLFL
jgi:hypothetical protein